MKRLLYITLLSILLLVAYAEAQAAGPDDEGFAINMTGGYIADADFEDSKGSAQVTSGGLAIEGYGFTFAYDVKKYAWDNAGRLNFSNGNEDPWDTLHQLYLGYDFEGVINDNWLYTAGVFGTSGFEKEMSGSFGAGLHGGLVYVFNDNWTAAFGGHMSADAIDLSIMPYLAVSYEDFDRDGSGAFMTLGLPASEAGYAFSEESALRMAFSMDGATYHLKEDSSVVRNGYIRTSSMKAGLYYDWTPSDMLSLTIGPEYHFNRKMNRYDDDGDKTGGTIDQDAALGAMMGFTLYF